MRTAQSQFDKNQFIREGLRLKDLSHRNVVTLLGVCLAAEPLLLVLEYMSLGDLKVLLRRCKETQTELHLSHLMSLALDVSSGFAYLQQRGFVHRDLAARNVMVSGLYLAKIGDFGSCHVGCRCSSDAVAQAWRVARTTQSTTQHAA
jgi:serine/threonine protein kinase